MRLSFYVQGWIRLRRVLLYPPCMVYIPQERPHLLLCLSLAMTPFRISHLVWCSQLRLWTLLSCWLYCGSLGSGYGDFVSWLSLTKGGRRVCFPSYLCFFLSCWWFPGLCDPFCIPSSFGLWTDSVVVDSFAVLSPVRPLGLLVFRGLKGLDELKESILWSNNGS